MKNAIVTTTALLAATLLASHAWATVKTGDVAGTQEAEITRTLEAAGYSDVEIETEDGKFEVEAKLNGTEYDLEISRETGKVISIKEDKDD